MKVNQWTILGLIMALIFAGVLFGVAKSSIPVAAEAYTDLADRFANNASIYGADASQFATDSKGYVGWFWVLGPFILVVLVIIGLFMKRGGSGGYRRHRRY